MPVICESFSEIRRTILGLIQGIHPEEGRTDNDDDDDDAQKKVAAELPMAASVSLMARQKTTSRAWAETGQTRPSHSRFLTFLSRPLTQGPAAPQSGQSRDRNEGANSYVNYASEERINKKGE